MKGSISVSQPVAASRSAIWRAVSEASGLARWQADAVTGGLDQGAFVLSWPSLGARLDLEVVQAVPEKRLVLRNGDATLELALHDGRIELEHRGLEPSDDLEGLRASWSIALSILSHYLSHHEGSDRHVSWIARSMRTSADMAHVFFTDRLALGSWLTRGEGGIGEVGTPVSFTSHWGARFTGQVIARRAGRDVAVQLTEPEDSVLVFRTLPAPHRETERLVAVVWSRWGTAPPQSTLPSQMLGAVGRLKSVLESVGGA